MLSVHCFRVNNIWRFYGKKEKAFNIFAGGVLFLLSLGNYLAAYQILQGQNIDIKPVKFRESYSKRLGDAYRFQRMSDEERI